METKISSLQFYLNNAIGRSDLNENCVPRTPEEEEEAANKDLIEQLSGMRNATTGEPIIK